MTRAQRAAKAASLHAQGLNGIQIAQRMGIGRSHAYELLSDPSGDGVRARKARRNGTCIDCGAETKNSGARVPPKRCHKCAPIHSRIWGPEEVIAAIQAWADEHGGIPPAATDWNPAHARTLGHPEKAEKFHADGCWPYTQQVQERFDSWNAAIRAAGFEPHPPGCYGRDGEDPAIIVEMVRLYRSGLSASKIAVLHGCHTTAVYYRLEKAGEPRRHSGWTWSKAA